MFCRSILSIVFSVSVFVTGTSAQNPVHIWSGSYGDADYQYSEAVAVDADGNVIITGTFAGTIDFGGVPLLSTSSTDFDIFVAKFDPWGNHIWSYDFGDTSYQGGVNVTADPFGNVVVAGVVNGEVNFGGGTLTSAGGPDIFIAKFGANGVHLWSQRFGDSDVQVVSDVAIDALGNIHLFGSFEGTVNFGGRSLVCMAYYRDTYIVKFDTDGNHVWSDSYGGTVIQYAGAVSVDGARNVYLTGGFEGEVSFGGGALGSAGVYDIFLVKLDDDGSHVWSQRFGDGDDDQGSALAVDNEGNIFAAGQFFGYLDLGGGSLLSADDADIFLARFDTNGNHVWSYRYGSEHNQHVAEVVLDVHGNVNLTGSFISGIDFGGGWLGNDGDYNIYVAKMAPNGSHIWSCGFGGAGFQYSMGGAVDMFGGPVITGRFDGVLAFAEGFPLAHSGQNDVFVARLSYPPEGACPGSPLLLVPDAPQYFSGFHHEERGAYITAIEDFEICALGIELNAMMPVPLTARIYEADGTTRGTLISSGSLMAAGAGIKMHYVPISCVLDECRDYDIAIEYELPYDLPVLDETEFDLPFDVGGTIRVRDGELSGNAADLNLPVFSIIGFRLGCPEYSDLAPPGYSWGLCSMPSEERGLYVTAKQTITLCAVGWAANFSTPVNEVRARIYEASGINRGAIIASGTGIVTSPGLQMHMIPISAVLEEGKEYDIAVAAEPASWSCMAEAPISPPYDIGDVITVRDAEQNGNASADILPHLAIQWTPGVGGAPGDLAKTTDVYPPPFSTSLSNTNYGLFLTSTIDQGLFSIGWEADVQSGETMHARVYEAMGTSRGALISYGSIVCGSDGTRWHDIPVAATLEAGHDYDVEIGFGQVNNWRYWEDYDGVPYASDGLFTVYSGSQGGSPHFHRLIHMRANTCGLSATAVDLSGPIHPPRFTLAAPYPNPISTSATVSYSLDSGGPVTIGVYDVKGRKVADLLDSAYRPAGTGSVELDARGIAAGVYFVKMLSNLKSVSRKITIIR